MPLGATPPGTTLCMTPLMLYLPSESRVLGACCPVPVPEAGLVDPAQLLPTAGLVHMRDPCPCSPLRPWQVASPGGYSALHPLCPVRLCLIAGPDWRPWSFGCRVPSAPAAAGVPGSQPHLPLEHQNPGSAGPSSCFQPAPPHRRSHHHRCERRRPLSAGGRVQWPENFLWTPSHPT